MIKKIFLWMLLLSVFSSSVFAGKTLDLDFEERDEYTLWFDEGDRILFEWGGYNHTLVLDAVEPKFTRLDVFLFLEERSNVLQYLSLNERTSAQLDFDRNNEGDLKIEIISSEPENEKSQILFKVMENGDPSEIIDYEKEYNIKEPETNVDTNINYVYFAPVVLVLLIIFIIYIGKRTKKDIYY